MNNSLNPKVTKNWKGGPTKRKCGGCMVCCFTMPIKEVGTRPGERCRHLCDKGCGIYETRPATCRGYACIWLWGRGSLEQRPDRMKAMPTIAEDGAQLALFLAKGLTPDTMTRAATKYMRDWHRKAKTAVLLIHGEGYTETTAVFPDGERISQPTNWAGELPTGDTEDVAESKDQD